MHLSSGALRSKASVAGFGPQVRNWSHRLEGHLHLLLPSQLFPCHPHWNCSCCPRPALACAVEAESNPRKGSRSHVSVPCLSPKCLLHKRGSAEGSILNAEKWIDNGRMSSARGCLSRDGVGHWPGLPRTLSGWKASPGEEPGTLGLPPSCKWSFPGGEDGTHRCTWPAEAPSHPLIFSHPRLSCFPACPIGGKVGDQKCVIVPCKVSQGAFQPAQGLVHGPYPIDSPGMNRHLQRSDHRRALKLPWAISEARNQTAKHFSTHKVKTADLERPNQRAECSVF